MKVFEDVVDILDPEMNLASDDEEEYDESYEEDMPSERSSEMATKPKLDQVKEENEE